MRRTQCTSQALPDEPEKELTLISLQNAARGLATTEKLDFEKFKTIHDVISNCGVA